LLEAARLLGIPAHCCVYVGDDERDVAAGRAAGMGTIVATYGYLGSKGNIAEWGADAHAASALDLLALLQKPVLA
jgi:N-acetyl-D-muramate 6-phosphate phosphatase